MLYKDIYLETRVVVRLSVHVQFNLGLLPRDSRVCGQHPPVCSIKLTVSLWSGKGRDADIMWCRATVCSDVEASILLDSAPVGSR